MITVPVAVHTELFRWQLSLFEFAHQRMYGEQAKNLAHAVVINRNTPFESKVDQIEWSLVLPHTLCESFFDLKYTLGFNPIASPLNIQVGLQQILSKFHETQVLEVTDCDMIHFRPAPELAPPHGQLLVCSLYEDWHLKSLTTNKQVISPYFENGGHYYNGGFVPIIGTVSTFRLILSEWIAVHNDILSRPYSSAFHWWAGMFALQAACEKKQVHMTAIDSCYIPPINQLSDAQYSGHYSCDPLFNKRGYPRIDTTGWNLSNPFYSLVRDWISSKPMMVSF